MYEVYRVRRRFQWNIWIYSPSGQCECSVNPGSNVMSERVGTAPNSESSIGMFDKNPCSDTQVCTGKNATGCTCADAGYCGMGGGFGSCSIKPFMHAGDIWLVNENDPRKEQIINRRFVIYDPTLPSGDELVKQEKYKMLVQGEPNPDKVYFPPEGEKIVSSEPVKPTTQSNDNKPATLIKEVVKT